MFLKPNVKQRFLRWYTLWDSSVDSQHAYLRFAVAPQEIAEIVEDLMVQPPEKRPT
jgi:hypothetical protein